MAERVYECGAAKKPELTKILEADPYAPDSFARVGYKMRDGATLGEEKDKLFVHFSASPDFIKKADERLKGIAEPLKGEKEKRIIKKIKEEEEAAESGLGSIFG